MKEVLSVPMSSPHIFADSEDLTAEHLEKFKKDRGTYKTFLQCEHCGYVREVTVPKGCYFYIRNIYHQPCLRDTKTDMEQVDASRCPNCDNIGVSIKPDLTE